MPLLSKPSAGAVLSEGEIKRLCGKGWLIDHPDDGCFKGAAYVLRVAHDGMCLPDGTVIEPGKPGRYSPIVMEPGQSVLVSSLEKVKMPADITGNMSIKGKLADQGVLALTGLIIDPHYPAEGEDESGFRRLHFRLANLGRDPVILEPGKTDFVSVQFFKLGEPTSLEPSSAFLDVWKRERQHPGGLEFIDRLGHHQERLDHLEAQSVRQTRSVSLVIGGGILVILTTLLGVSLAALLSLGSDSGIVDAAAAVIPDHPSEQILGVAALFGIAAIAGAVSLGIVKRQPPIGERDRQPPRAHNEAYGALAVVRRRDVGTASLAAVALLVLLAGLLIDNDVHWLLIIGAVSIGLVAATWIIAARIWRPIRPRDVDDLVSEWFADPTT